MSRTDQTLMEQMKITWLEISRRKEYLGFEEADAKILSDLRPIISEHVDDICEQFYKRLLVFDEMDRIIGDIETLHRLKNYQRQYIISLFDGQYDEEYVHSRLRVGLVHRRIGLDPKFYMAAVFHLKQIFHDVLLGHVKSDYTVCSIWLLAVDKILNFDLALIIDTYISSLMEQAQHSRDKLAEYTRSLEDTVAKRTRRLKDQARRDGLTGLLNQNTFYKELRRELSRANRLNYPVTLLYFDLDNFKKLNDTKGHKAGDEILIAVAQTLKKVSRKDEITARYGGDEFCAILSDCPMKGGVVAAKRLRTAIGESVKGTDISCSIGIACSTPQKMLDADLLVKKADAAMYEAKKIEGFSIHADAVGEPPHAKSEKS